MIELSQDDKSCIIEALEYKIERRNEDLEYFSPHEDCYQDLLDDLNNAEKIQKKLELIWGSK